MHRALTQDLRRWWMNRRGAKPTEARRCLGKLLNPRHHCASHKCGFSLDGEFDVARFVAGALDHLEVFRDREGRFILVGQPYGLLRLGELRRWTDRHGLRVEVNVDPSWHADVTDLVVVYGRTAAEAQRQREALRSLRLQRGMARDA